MKLCVACNYLNKDDQAKYCNECGCDISNVRPIEKAVLKEEPDCAVNGISIEGPKVGDFVASSHSKIDMATEFIESSIGNDKKTTGSILKVKGTEAGDFAATGNAQINMSTKVKKGSEMLSEEYKQDTTQNVSGSKTGDFIATGEAYVDISTNVITTYNILQETTVQCNYCKNNKKKTETFSCPKCGNYYCVAHQDSENLLCTACSEKRKLDQKRIENLLSEAENVFKIENYMEASRKYGEVLQLEASNIQASEGKAAAEVKNEIRRLFSAATKAREREDFEEALTVYDEILNIDKHNEEAAFGKAKVEVEKSRSMAKREQVAKLIELAREKTRENKLNETIHLYEEVLSLDADNTVALHEKEEVQNKILNREERKKSLLANAQRESVVGSYDEALRLYNEVLELDKNNFEAISSKAAIKEHLRQKEEELESLLEDAERAVKYRIYPEAKDRYERALKLRHDEQRAINGLEQVKNTLASDVITIVAVQKEIAGIQMALIPGNEDINSFWIQRTPVSQALWLEVMHKASPSRFKEDRNLPVESVSWEFVQDFIRRLNRVKGTNFRLPTEKEWEYSAKAGSTSCYHFGSDISKLKDYAWYQKARTAKVVNCTRMPNAYSLYDVHGNVYEWCEENSSENSKGHDETKYSKVSILKPARGGSWKSTPKGCEFSARKNLPVDKGSDEVGFRLALDKEYEETAKSDFDELLDLPDF